MHPSEKPCMNNVVFCWELVEGIPHKKTISLAKDGSDSGENFTTLILEKLFNFYDIKQKIKCSYSEMKFVGKLAFVSFVAEKESQTNVKIEMTFMLVFPRVLNCICRNYPRLTAKDHSKECTASVIKIRSLIALNHIKNYILAGGRNDFAKRYIFLHIIERTMDDIMKSKKVWSKD